MVIIVLANCKTFIKMVVISIEISDPLGLTDTAVVTITVGKAELEAENSVAVFNPNNEGLYALPGEDVIYTISVINIGNMATNTDSVLEGNKLTLK